MTLQIRAVFGPPRPVLVVFVGGEVDRSNQSEFERVLDAVTAQRGTAHFLTEFGCREVAQTWVVDLREATFVGTSVLFGLAQLRDENGCPPRLVVAGNGVVCRALIASGLDDVFELFSDLVDAVLTPPVHPRHRD